MAKLWNTTASFVAVGVLALQALSAKGNHCLEAVSGKFVIDSLQLGFVATFKLELTLWSSSSSRFGATSRPAHDTDTASHLKTKEICSHLVLLGCTTLDAGKHSLCMPAVVSHNVIATGALLPC